MGNLNRSFIFTVAIALALGGTCYADVFTELRLGAKSSTGEYVSESSTSTTEGDIENTGFTTSLRVFFPSLKDDPDRPIALREFYQHPCSIKADYSANKGTTSYKSGQEYDTESNSLGGELSLFTPPENFSTGLTLAYNRLENDYSSPTNSAYVEYTQENKTIDVTINQNFSKYFRLSATYNKKDVESDRENSIDSSENLFGANIKFVIADIISIGLGGKAGEKENDTTAKYNQYDVASGNAEVGFYFGKHVSLIVAAKATEYDLQDSPSEYKQKLVDGAATLNIWFNEHYLLSLGGFTNEAKTESQTSESTSDNNGGKVELAFRY